VLNIDFSGNRIQSQVQGTRKDPYKVSIEIRWIDDKSWSQVIEAMASQAIFAAKLLAGEMPQNIEEAFSSAGVALFPERAADLKTECSCPDYANPCKHISAVYYLLGERFDADPFLLFQLRGKSRDEVIADLRARRGAAAGDPGVNEIRAPRKSRHRAETSKSGIPILESGQQNASIPQPVARTSNSGTHASNRDANALGKELLSADEEAVSFSEMGSISNEDPGLPLDEALDRFWGLSNDIESIEFTIARPEVDAAPVKRLGQPPFWTSKLDFIAEMESIYRSISEAAIKAALSE